MLAMANKNGYVFGSVPGLAKMANIPVEATRNALAKFQLPDPDSRSQEYEGRRIEIVDGGWRLLTYLKHRAIRDEEERREYLKLYMRGYRKQKSLTNVNNVNPSKPQLSQAEADTEADSRSKIQKHIHPTLEEVLTYCKERNSPIDGEHFWNYYEARNWKDIKKWKSAIVTWEKNQKGNANGSVHESPSERRARKNQEIADQYRRECANDDSKALF
jgi:hypothetical protein